MDTNGKKTEKKAQGGSMDKKRKSELINRLLTLLDQELIDQGKTPNELMFSFFEDDEYDKKYLDELNISNDEFICILNACKSKKYLEQKMSYGFNEFFGLVLTSSGRTIAEFSELNHHRNSTEKNITINNNISEINGPAQFGDNNTQNFKDVFTMLINEIEKSNASTEEKNDAKGLLQKLIEKLIITGIISSGTSAAVGKITEHFLTK